MSWVQIPTKAVCVHITLMPFQKTWIQFSPSSYSKADWTLWGAANKENSNFEFKPYK